MEALIQNIKESSIQVQAVAVTVGGLIGVFATLAVFYVLIAIADRVGGKAKSD
jgi:hypothetical protein